MAFCSTVHTSLWRIFMSFGYKEFPSINYLIYFLLPVVPFTFIYVFLDFSIRIVSCRYPVFLILHCQHLLFSNNFFMPYLPYQISLFFCLLVSFKDIISLFLKIQCFFSIWLYLLIYLCINIFRFFNHKELKIWMKTLCSYLRLIYAWTFLQVDQLRTQWSQETE